MRATSRSARSRRGFGLEVFCLCAIVGLEAGTLAGGLTTRLNYDEGVYLASLDGLRRGDELGEEIFASQPPGFYALVRLSAATFGGDPADVRLGFLIVGLIGVLAAYATGRLLAGPLAGLAAAAVLAVAPPFPIESTRVAADVPSVVLALGAVVVTALAARSGSLALSALAGAAAAAAVSVKLLALTALVPVAALALARRPSGRALGAAGAGALAVAAAFALDNAAALPELWDSTVAFHAQAGEGLGSLDENAGMILRAFHPRTPFTWIAAAAVAVAAVDAVRRRRLRLWPLWSWVAASILFLLAVDPLLDHHLVLLAGSLAVAAGTAFGSAIARAGEPLRAAGALALVVAVAGGFVQENRRLARSDLAEPDEVLWAASLIRSSTRPGETIVTDLPKLAYLTGRRLPPELVDTSAVRFDTGSLTPTAILDSIDRSRTRLVVVARTFALYPEIMAGLRARFETIRRRPGAIAFQNRR